MLNTPVRSRQPTRQPWTLDRLLLERSIALGMSLASGTFSAYSSALNSYLSFCNLHHFPIDPTADTLSLYITWMSAHIKPDSVYSYLSGIVNQLEPHYPHVRDSRKHPLVCRTLAGCRRRFGTAQTRKEPLSASDLHLILEQLPRPWNFDDVLFICLLLVGFLGLLRLGEITVPDSVKQLDHRRIPPRSATLFTPSQFTFLLPAHKADKFFEGNRILITPRPHLPDPLLPLQSYLCGRDSRFPFFPQLWLCANGRPPTRTWFLHRLHALSNHHFGGHSLRAGGATDLALHGASLQVIQAAGRWASNAFQVYIRKNPFLIHAALTTKSTP